MTPATTADLFNESLEANILGAIMRRATSRGDNITYQVRATLKDSDRFFYSGNRVIYDAVLSLTDRNGLPTSTRVAEELRRTNRTEEAGRPFEDGAAVVARMERETTIATTDEFSTALEQLVALSALRQIDGVLSAGRSRLSHGDADVTELAAGVSRDMWNIADGHSAEQSGGSAHEVSLRLIAHMEQMQLKGPDEGLYLRTGLLAVDGVLLRSVKPGHLVIIGAHSSVGKSTLAANILRANGIHGKLKPTLLSLEMTDWEFGSKVLSAETRVPFSKLQDPGTLTPDQWEEVRGYAEFTRENPDLYYAYHMPGATLDAVCAKMRTNRARFGSRLFIVDYAQLLKVPKSHSREREVAAITSTLKGLAGELDAVIVLLSQLNDEMFSMPSRKNSYPQPRDLRESKAQEQDADTILLIDRPFTRPEPEHSFHDGTACTAYDTTTGELIEYARIHIGKNRNGEKAVGPFAPRVKWEGAYATFSDAPDKNVPVEPQGYQPLARADYEPTTGEAF